MSTTTNTLVLTALVLCMFQCSIGASLKGKALVDFINSKQSSWRAEYYPRFEGQKPKYGLLRTEKSREAYRKLPRAESRHLDIDLPKNFDSREHWPECKRIIGHVRDQGNCGSCWAFGASGPMADRLCIASKGKIKVTISAEDLMACCTECGGGCNGGDSFTSYNHWVEQGIVSGGDYNSKEGCMPYEMPNCEHHNNKTTYPPCPPEMDPTPKCEAQCQSAFNGTYEKSKYHGKKVYNVDPDEEAIRKEIYANGPVTAGMFVYDDFVHYSGGIYHHEVEEGGDGHSVKILGWGEENGKLYWLLMNSWNKDWGENGLFRMERGTDESSIESEIVAGVPDLERSPSA